MKFLVIYTPDTPTETATATTQDPGRGETMATYATRQAEAGVLLSQAMFDAPAARVQQRGGAVTVAERQDQRMGYAFLEATSREAAIEITKEFLQVAGDGVCEVRGVLDAAPQPR